MISDAGGSPPTGAPGPPGPGAGSTPPQPFPGADDLNVVLFGPTPDPGPHKQDETSVLDAWHNWQTRIGFTNVQQIKKGHIMLDNVENLIRTHR